MSKEIYVVVTERDTPDPFDNGGPIVMETNIAKSDLPAAIERARGFGSRYGAVQIGVVRLIGSIDEIGLKIEMGEPPF